MKLTYDPRYNIAYLKLHEKNTKVETIKISEELNIDIAPNGTIYGIEFLNANEQLQREGDQAFLIVNEATGDQTEVNLSQR
jgi:uncharacterized protein YuzE